MGGQNTNITSYEEVVDAEEIKHLIKPTPFVTELTENDVVEMLVTSGAILKGHFRLLSKRHSLMFLAFGKIGRKNGYRQRISDEITARFKNHDIHAVVTPISAGGLLGSRVANGLGVEAFYVDVDEESGHPVPFFVNGHAIESSMKDIQRVLIVNDLTTTGTGLNTMIKLIQKVGVEVANIAVFATRYEGNIDEFTSRLGGLPVENIDFLLELDKKAFQTFTEAECPYPDCPNAPIIESRELNV